MSVEELSLSTQYELYLIRWMQFESDRQRMFLLRGCHFKCLMVVCSLLCFASSFTVSTSWSMSCNPFLNSHNCLMFESILCSILRLWKLHMYLTAHLFIASWLFERLGGNGRFNKCLVELWGLENYTFGGTLKYIKWNLMIPYHLFII